MKKLTYYPGCSSHGTSLEYDHTMRITLKSLDVAVQDMTDWNCCGATSAHVMTENLALALPLRNLIMAEKVSNDPMVISCAACYSRMKATKIEMDSKPDLRKKINTTVEEGTYMGTVDVKSLLQYCYEDVGIDEIKLRVKKPLWGLKVACYYGCLLTRPKHIANFDSAEYPMSMDHIVEALGAKAVDFDYKTECCGASFSISNTELVVELTGKILEVAKEAGADIIAVACPMCQSNLDMRQFQIEKSRGEKFDIPVVYITQLMALAFGHPVSELKLSRHIVPAEPMLGKILNEPPQEEKKVKPVKKAVAKTVEETE